MFFEANNVKGMKMVAQDGEFGKVLDLYFDDQDWAVRYLVVNTGNFFIRREVLISPIGIDRPLFENGTIPVNLSKKEIEDSPDIPLERPVSRQMEQKYYQYFNWPPYWGLRGPWAMGPYGVPWMEYPNVELNQVPGDVPVPQMEEDIHLRSVNEIRGYHIKTDEDEFGKVEDVLIEDHSWALRYFVIDTVNWWPSKSVLISPAWIKNISWEDKNVVVNLSKKQIMECPEYSQGAVDRNYEQSLHQHYGKPFYWEGERPYYPPEGDRDLRVP